MRETMVEGRDEPGEPREPLGRTLRRLRVGRGASLGDLARRVSVPKASLIDWETGRYPPPSAALDRLLLALDVAARERAALLARTGSRHARVHLARTPWGAPVDLGQVLRALRLRGERRQDEVARALGVRQGTLAKWESGEATPEDERLVAALGVLGATPEESRALRLAVRGEAPTLGDAEERIAWISYHQPVPLRDVLLLQMEAELWWRATREAAADALLGHAIAARAQQSLVRGARGEIVAHAGRAIRLARISGDLDRAAPAVYAANWVRQRTPGGAAGAARSLGSWRGRLRDPARRDWLTASQALALVRAGETRAGIGLLEGLVDGAGEGSWERRHYRTDLVEAWLIAGAPERAHEELGAMGDDPCEISAAKVAAALGREPSPVVMDRLRAAPDWLGRDEAARIERLSAQVRRGVPPRLD